MISAVRRWFRARALLSAIHSGDIGRVRALADTAGADATPAQAVVFANGNTPVAEAVMVHRSDVLAALLGLGCDPNQPVRAGAQTPLMMAINEQLAEDGPAILALLVKHGSNLEARDARGNTALHHAVLSGNRDALAYLLDSGANPNAQDETGISPLILARSFAPGPDIAELLLAHGADPNLTDHNGKTYLM